MRTPYIFVPGLLVFIRLLPVEEIMNILDTLDLSHVVVVPYWYPDDPRKTFTAAKILRAMVGPTVKVGIVAIGKDRDLFKFITDAMMHEYDLIILTQDNLGSSPDKTLYELGSQGVFRSDQQFHVACDSGPPGANMTWSTDFTDQRIEEVDEACQKLMETPLKYAVTKN